jgi:hypothetical protein
MAEENIQKKATFALLNNTIKSVSVLLLLLLLFGNTFLELQRKIAFVFMKLGDNIATPYCWRLADHFRSTSNSRCPVTIDGLLRQGSSSSFINSPSYSEEDAKPAVGRLRAPHLV